MAKILLTGGAGYIGSHTFVALSNAGHQPIILDNFSNSSRDTIQRLKELSNEVVVFEGDIRDSTDVSDALQGVELVVHFAGLKSVVDSISRPFNYFDNNVRGSITVLAEMANKGIDKIVFSSTASLYGNLDYPAHESDQRKFNNPYSQTKMMVEDIITGSNIKAGILRYFNPIGSHPSGLIGENIKNLPDNLLPHIINAASSNKPLQIFGNAYPTKDGTCIRDFIDVMDLADGHVAAVNHLLTSDTSFICNLGTGVGCSVMGLVDKFSSVNGIDVPYKICHNRDGDIISSVADVSYAKHLLGWSAKRTIEDSLQSAWLWHQLQSKKL